MADEPPTPTKSERTRERIRDAAFALFGERGYEQTTMRDIAARAGCALGLIYRYFPRREDLVFALFTVVEARTTEAWQQIGPGPLAARVDAALRAKVGEMWPHRRAYAAIASAVLDRDSDAGVFNPKSAPIRRHMREALRDLVLGAEDAPSEADADRIAQALFVVQLAVMVAATQDPHADGRTTYALIDTLATMMGALRPMLPLVGPMLDQLVAHVAAFEATATS